MINTDLHLHDIDLSLHCLHCSHKICNDQGWRLRRESIRHQCCQNQIDWIDTTQSIKVSCEEVLSDENIYSLSSELSAYISENSLYIVVWLLAVNSRRATTAEMTVKDLQKTISKLQKQTLSETQQRRMKLTVQKVNLNVSSTDLLWSSCTCVCWSSSLQYSRCTEHLLKLHRSIACNSRLSMLDYQREHTSLMSATCSVQWFPWELSVHSSKTVLSLISLLLCCVRLSLLHHSQWQKEQWLHDWQRWQQWCHHQSQHWRRRQQRRLDQRRRWRQRRQRRRQSSSQQFERSWRRRWECLHQQRDLLRQQHR